MHDPDDADTLRSDWTDEDLRDERNRTAIEARVAPARWGAVGLAIAGSVGLGGWLWLTVRTQMQATTTFGFRIDDSGSIGLLERLDLLSTTLSQFVFSSGALALGLFARSAIDHFVAAGGALPRVRPASSEVEVH